MTPEPRGGQTPDLSQVGPLRAAQGHRDRAGPPLHHDFVGPPLQGPGALNPAGADVREGGEEGVRSLTERTHSGAGPA